MCLVLPPWDILLTLDAPGRRGGFPFPFHPRWKQSRGAVSPRCCWAGPAGATAAALALCPRDEGLCHGLYCPLVATANTAGETGAAGLGSPEHPVLAREPGRRCEPHF